MCNANIHYFTTTENTPKQTTRKRTTKLAYNKLKNTFFLSLNRAYVHNESIENNHVYIFQNIRPKIPD